MLTVDSHGGESANSSTEVASASDGALGARVVGSDSPPANKTRSGTLSRILFWGGLITGAALLLLSPLAKPLWTDEVLSLSPAQRPVLEILQGEATPRDHTPVHALVLYTARRVFGDALTTYRLISALPAAFLPYIAFLIGKRINLNVGLLTLWLVAIAPGSVLFDRMARYHGLLALLTTWSTYLFLRCLGTGRKKLLVGYTLVTIAMLLTYVPSLFVVLGHVLTLAYNWRREKHATKALLAIAVCGACLLPVLLWQLAPNGNAGAGMVSVEDPSVGQGFGGFLRRVALPIYVYCIGETVYPWSWPVSIPGILVALVAFGAGAVCVRRTREMVVPVALVVTTLMFALVTSGSLGALQTFGSMGKRNAFLIPLFCVTVAIGLMSMRQRALRTVFTMVVFLAWGYANYNYWAGREFLNPTYTAPWSAVMRRLESEGFRDNAMIVTNEEVVEHTLAQNNIKVPIVMPNSPAISSYGRVKNALALSLARKANRRYIYVIGRDRGNRLAVGLEDGVNAELFRRYMCTYEAGFMERTPDERYWLEKVLKRPVSRYYVWVKRFDTFTPANRSGAHTNPLNEVNL